MTLREQMKADAEKRATIIVDEAKNRLDEFCGDYSECVIKILANPNRSATAWVNLRRRILETLENDLMKKYNDQVDFMDDAIEEKEGKL